MPESKFYHFSEKGFYYAVETLESAITASAEDGFIWLDYYDPAKEDLNKLVDTLGIHPLSVEDCLDNKQIPKIEFFPDNSFIIFNSFSYVNKTLFVDEVNFFIGKKFLISVSGHSSGSRKPLQHIDSIVANEAVKAKDGPASLMQIIIDHLVDEKFQSFEALEEELEEAEENLLNNPSAFSPSELIRLRKSLLNLRKSLFHEREILVKICRLDCPFIGEKSIFHYRDIYDHLVRFFELTETYRELVTSLMELYTSLLNNLMTRTSNETNASVRRLTLIATVFMPLTLLAGIGGMSEWTMMTGPSKWRLAYPLFMAGMAVIGIIIYYLIRRIERNNLKSRRRSNNWEAD